MNRYVSIVCSVLLVLMVALAGQASAASITETTAAIGKDCVASGPYSTAMGYNTTAGGTASTAMGYYTDASGNYSTAMGYYTDAIGNHSTAMGQGTGAIGGYSTAMGYNTTAGGDYSIAMGLATIASGSYSTAMGYLTTASGNYSTAMGSYTDAIGNYSTAMGYLTTATGDLSSVIGRGWSHEHPLINDVPYSFMVAYMGSESDTTPEFFVKNGSVGIGTKTPQNLLDLGETQGKKLAVFQKPTGEDFYGLGISSATLEIYAGVTSDDTDPAMVVKKSTGNVGIGTKDPDFLLEVNGSAGKPGGGSWSNSSDERLKDVTGAYARGLDEIIRLRPIAFHYKENNPRGLPSEEEYIGFIAQEVQGVFPEAVSEGSDGYLDFNMHPVNVALVNAVRELKAENEALRQEIAQIKAALGM